jgi:ATP-binding protein involved in chromosome partitioning
MRFAIPLTDGKISSHFGHCQCFAIIDSDNDSKTITEMQMITPPAHEPGAFPKWLSGLNAEVVIAQGIGQRAKALFGQTGIKVIAGADGDNPEEIVTKYLQGMLQCGPNVCDH